MQDDCNVEFLMSWLDDVSSVSNVIILLGCTQPIPPCAVTMFAT